MTIVSPLWRALEPRYRSTQDFINNVTALAKTAKAFDIPTILTTVNEERGGL